MRLYKKQGCETHCHGKHEKVMLILHVHVFQPTFQNDKNDIAWLIQK
jgi:hypothetical protein